MLIMNMVLGIDNLNPKLQIRANLVPALKFAPIFNKIWHSQQIEHANYDYNTRQCPERLRHYRLRVIVGSE